MKEVPPSPQFASNACNASNASSAGSGKGFRVGGFTGWDFGEKEVPPSPHFDINDINAVNTTRAGTNETKGRMRTESRRIGSKGTS